MDHFARLRHLDTQFRHLCDVATEEQFGLRWTLYRNFFDLWGYELNEALNEDDDDVFFW